MGPAEGASLVTWGAVSAPSPPLPCVWTAHSSPAGPLGLVASLLPHPCPALLSTSCLLSDPGVFLSSSLLPLSPLSGSTLLQPLAQWSLAPALHTGHILVTQYVPLTGRELLRGRGCLVGGDSPGPCRSWLTDQVVRNGGHLPEQVWGSRCHDGTQCEAGWPARPQSEQVRLV